jgi:hypothetical protein
MSNKAPIVKILPEAKPGVQSMNAMEIGVKGMGDKEA